MDFPTRMSWGMGVRYRDYPGCINSGSAPVLLKSRTAESLIGKPFAVGPEIEVQRNYENILAKKMGRKSRVRYFKTYKAAKRHFLTLCGPIDAAYAEVREAKERASRPVKTAQDFADVLDANMVLADNGII